MNAHIPRRRITVGVLCVVMLLAIAGSSFASGTIVQDRSSDEITIAFRHLRDEYIINTYMENGEITPHGSVRVKAGGNQTFSFTPNAGYQLQTVKVDGEVVWNRSTTSGEPPTGYAFRRVLADHDLEVVFTMIPATATPTPTPTRTATASPTPTPTLSYVTATPTTTPRTGGGGGGGGGGGAVAPTTAPPSSGAIQLPDGDVPQSGIGASTVGECIE